MFLNWIAIIGGSLLGGLLVHYKFKRNEEKTNKITYKCILHTIDGVIEIGNPSAQKRSCSNTLQHIVEFIDEAKHSLDLCFYMITELHIILSVIRAKVRNVKVRLITDQNDGIVPNKNFGLLFKEGKVIYFYSSNNIFITLYFVGVKVYSKQYNNYASIMHNKFIIRDCNTLLQGSLNLTATTANSSFDNVMITNDPALITAFRDYFEDIIKLFE